MTNQIRNVAIVNHRLDPNETELHLLVEVEQLTAATEVKGRLMGPRNAYTTTVEVAYAAREISRNERIVLRVIIPEPSCWTPKNPFLYQGLLELWQDGQLCQRVQISHGVRWLHLSAKGLKLNGQPLVLRGKIVEPSFSSEQARQWHDAGYNALITQLPDDGLEAWNNADQFGLLMLGEGNGYLAQFLLRHHALNQHPSTFGWIAHHAEWLDPSIVEMIQPMWMGVHYSAGDRPTVTSFLACKWEELESLEGIDLPKIIITDQLPAALPNLPGVIGWIERGRK